MEPGSLCRLQLSLVPNLNFHESQASTTRTVSADGSSPSSHNFLRPGSHLVTSHGSSERLAVQVVPSRHCFRSGAERPLKSPLSCRLREGESFMSSSSSGASPGQEQQQVASDSCPPGNSDAAMRQWPRGGGWVHAAADVDESVVVEATAVVQEGAVVGRGSRIGAGSVVGQSVVVGSETRLGFNVSLQKCSIGDGCVLHNGVSIGQDGFGFFVNEKGEMVKKPQPLGVKIGSFVEIGANSCVDCGSWRDTTIGDHVKIDNLVQIGHNVVIGRCCIICGQCGIGGSSTLGDYVVLAGKVGVADHVSIVSKVRVGAKGGVVSDITEPGDYAGFPAVPAYEWRRQVVNLRKLGRGKQGSEEEQTN